MHYDHKNIEYSRKLRKNMTPWERKLWYCYLNHYPVRFYRQKPIDRFIVDFFCAKSGLIVEVDGGGHYSPEEKQKDQERTKQLESLGLKVIRFSNRDINQNFQGVCTVIDMEVNCRSMR